MADQEVLRVAVVDRGPPTRRRPDEQRPDGGQRYGGGHQYPVHPAHHRVPGQQLAQRGAFRGEPADRVAADAAGHAWYLRPSSNFSLRSGASATTDVASAGPPEALPG